MATKLCQDCRFCGPWGWQMPARCQHPSALTELGAPHTQLLCATAREFGRLCGPAGQNFEPRVAPASVLPEARHERGFPATTASAPDFRALPAEIIAADYALTAFLLSSGTAESITEAWAREHEARAGRYTKAILAACDALASTRNV